MLIVSARGSTNPDTRGDTPRCCCARMVKGKAAAAEHVLKPTIAGSITFLKKCRGFTLAKEPTAIV